MNLVLESPEVRPPTGSLFEVPPGAALDHRIYRHFDSQLKSLCDEWDTFIEQNGGDLYSSFDWCRTWWTHYGHGRRLYVHTLRDDGRLVAILPTFHERLHYGVITLRTIRLVGCDHSTTTCGVTIAPEHVEAVMQFYGRWLDRRTDWDLLHWGPLPGYFRDGNRLVGSLARHGPWSATIRTEGTPHIVWELPDSFEIYWRGLAKKERSNIKIVRKRCADAALTDSATTKAELARWFPMFIEQHQKQWQAEGKLGHFGDWPGAAEFHDDLSKTMQAQGRLWLLRLDVDSKPIGFQYNYRFGRFVHWLLGSRDIDPKWEAYGCGRVLHAATIEQAIESGMTHIDGLKGMYDYKLRLGGKVMNLQSIYLVRQKLLCRWRTHWVQLLADVLDLVYYRIWFCRLRPRLRLPGKPLWRFWIRSRFGR